MSRRSAPRTSESARRSVSQVGPTRLVALRRLPPALRELHFWKGMLARLDRTAHCFDDESCLLRLKMRSYGQTQHGLSQAFRDREVARRPLSVRVCPGQMRRNGIVNQRPYARLRESLLQREAVRVLEYKKVPDR